MENFRRSKRTVSGDVDGILRSRMRKPMGPKASITRPRAGATRMGSQAPDARIGNFAKKEGFIPRHTKPIMPDGRSLGRKRRHVPPIDMTIEEKPLKKRRTGKWKVNRKLLLRGVMGVFLLVIIVGGYLAGKGYLRARQVFQGGGEAFIDSCEPKLESLKTEGDGRVNFLILGKGGPEQTDGPDLTDTIIVASLDPCNKDAGLLSIPRDLAVKMQSGETTKINSVYALTKMSAKAKKQSDEDAEKAGIEAIENTVENITGLTMNRYVMLDFTAFEQAIDAVGGITIDVKKPVYEKMRLKGKSYTLDVKTGPQEFNGLRALAYSRSRYTSERGDFDRSERQREIIVALKDKVFSAGTFSNPVKISQLIDAFGTRVRTNIGGTDEIRRLYTIGQDVGSSNIASVSLVDEPNILITSGGANLGIGSAQVPREGVYKYDAIRSFIRNTFKDSFIRKENPGIAVLNGTTISGIAKTRSDTLKSYGYNVVEVGDAADKNTAVTTIIDLKKKDTKYTKYYLEKRFNTTATTKLPDGITPPQGADFVIIIGQNETSNR
jgi:LCP family protein required for cell wall assembly